MMYLDDFIESLQRFAKECPVVLPVEVHVEHDKGFGDIKVLKSNIPMNFLRLDNPEEPTLPELTPTHDREELYSCYAKQLQQLKENGATESCRMLVHASNFRALLDESGLHFLAVKRHDEIVERGHLMELPVCILDTILIQIRANKIIEDAKKTARISGA